MLIRLVVVEGRVISDPPPRTAGRAAYLCRDPACWTLAEKRRALERALPVRMAGEDWMRLRAGILA
jgi:predicted RNA-binding protein YlxR (DUF448 family)